MKDGSFPSSLSRHITYQRAKKRQEMVKKETEKILSHVYPAQAGPALPFGFAGGIEERLGRKPKDFPGI